jgi:hypothetical protein
MVNKHPQFNKVSNIITKLLLFATSFIWSHKLFDDRSDKFCGPPVQSTGWESIG